MMKTFFSVIFCIFASVLFFSCMSLQEDIIMSSEGFVQTEEILSFEQRLSFLDAKRILSENTEKSFESEVLLLASDVEKAVLNAGMNHALIARLYAIEGTAYSLKNANGKAKSFYKKSDSAFKGDVRALILGNRIGIVSNLEDKNVLSVASENPLLELELGLQRYENGLYAECVAFLDKAFLVLPDFYKETYASVRENAWNLRNVTSVLQNKKLREILNKSSVTVGEMLLVTQETSSVLSSYTGGKKLSESELFSKTKGANLFESARIIENDEKTETVLKGTVLTRVLSARFLWNILCNRKNQNLKKTKYSDVYSKKEVSSPILDVEVSNPDFDAILGSVENELMKLPDGRNFFPEKNVSAAEFHSWIDKIR